MIYHLARVAEVVLFEQSSQILFVELICKVICMLVENVFVHELGCLESLIAALDLTLVYLSFLYWLRLAHHILILHLLQYVLAGPQIQALFSSTKVLFLELLGSNPVLVLVDLLPGDLFGISKVLRSASCRKNTLVFELLPAIVAVGMDSSQIEKKQVEELRFCQVLLPVGLDLTENVCRYFLLWIENI